MFNDHTHEYFTSFWTQLTENVFEIPCKYPSFDPSYSIPFTSTCQFITTVKGDIKKSIDPPLIDLRDHLMLYTKNS